MKRTIRTALAGVLAFGLSAGAAMAQEVTLRFQHFISPRGSVPQYFMRPWADKVQADSGGRIRIALYPPMQLGGSPPSMYDQIRDG
ncbi:MAG: C4-dicarboxylate ABC transporter, partial [Halocynthiibacter sp.]